MLVIKDLIDMSLSEMSAHAYPKAEADSVKIEYNLNSHGFRCNEILNQKILMLGCSQTEGHGMPLELTWPYLLSKKMNSDYINLAKGGDGAQAQVVKAFQFFKEFYKPDYIFAAFPLCRLDVPLTTDNLVRNVFDKKIGKAIFDNARMEKFSKIPHDVEKVLTEEFAIYYNILFIKLLIEYCNSNKIKFIWFNYHDNRIKSPELENLSTTLSDKDSSGYFSYKNLFLDDIAGNAGASRPTWDPRQNIEALKCHNDFSNNKFFKRAADYDYWPPGHWNFHQHLHIAEYMYKMVDMV